MVIRASQCSASGADHGLASAGWERLNMPRQGNYTQQQANDLLIDYVRPEECASTDVPRDLPQQLVSHWVRNELKASFSHAEMDRAMRVVRYYVLRERVEQLVPMLNGSPRDHNELRHTCHLIAAICELGDPQQQGQAVAVYDQLVAGRASEDSKDLKLLVETYFHLPAGANKKPITDRAAQLRADAERKGNEKELWRYEECERRLLPRVILEKSRRDWLIKMPPGPERDRLWAEAYLMYDMNTPFKWDEAAGFGLLRLGRDDGDPAAIEALKGAMRRIDPNKDEVELVQFRKTRGYNARAYFLEDFDPDTRRDLKAAATSQDDLIK
jgi:hypothetical protein